MNTHFIRSQIGALALGLTLVTSLFAQNAEPVDWDVVSRIRAEAFNRPQVSELLKELTEQVGPRLTASPAAVKANEWARAKLSGWGLANVHDEVWDEAFGRGWAFRSASLEWISPRALPLPVLQPSLPRALAQPVLRRR